MGYVRSGGNGHREFLHYETVYEHAQAPTPKESERADRTTARVLASVASIETLGGAAAVTLAILGLVRPAARDLAGVVTLVIGFALVALGGGVAARWKATGRHTAHRVGLAGEIGTEILGGLCGLVLGVLALAQVYPEVLLPIAAVVFGGSLLLGGVAQPQLARFALGAGRRRRRPRSGAEAAGGLMALAGAAAVALGILALVGAGPAGTLTLVAMLCLGGAMFVGGSTLTARFAHASS